MFLFHISKIQILQISAAFPMDVNVEVIIEWQLFSFFTELFLIKAWLYLYLYLIFRGKYSSFSHTSQLFCFKKIEFASRYHVTVCEGFSTGLIEVLHVAYDLFWATWYTGVSVRLNWELRCGVSEGFICFEGAQIFSQICHADKVIKYNDLL